MEVAPGRVVTLEYTVRLASGELVDSTGGCGPVSILYGAGQLFAPLETRLAGMRAGETRELRIPADEAWGEPLPGLVRTMPRDRLPPDLELEVGRQYVLRTDEGRALRFRVRALGPETVEERTYVKDEPDARRKGWKRWFRARSKRDGGAST